ncbi:hypothetical protein D3C72_947590 [compost metagenome]
MGHGPHQFVICQIQTPRHAVGVEVIDAVLGRRIVICKLPHGVDALAPGQHEQSGGIGHFGDVVAIFEQFRSVGTAIDIARLHAIMRIQNDVWYVRMGVKKCENIF